MQDDDTRTLVRSLVASGQLTFSNGGFTMFDEASPTGWVSPRYLPPTYIFRPSLRLQAGPSYVDMLDQTTLGIRFILSEFGASGERGLI